MVVMFKILRLEWSVVNRSRSSVRNLVFFVSNKYFGSVTQQLFLSRVRRRYLGTNKSIVFQGNPAMKAQVFLDVPDSYSANGKGLDFLFMQSQVRGLAQVRSKIMKLVKWHLICQESSPFECLRYKQSTRDFFRSFILGVSKKGNPPFEGRLLLLLLLLVSW